MSGASAGSPWPGCEPYPGSVNQPGETERLGDVTVTHHFVKVLRSRYHFVTAGDPSNHPVVMLHGLPESWFAFYNQVRDLADEFYVIALDLKGYGQSEKDPGEEYSFPRCALELGLLLDKLGVDRFSLVTHDRGSVLGDQLCNLPNGFNRRIVKYARMQQSANHPHAEPRPPHHLFASHVGPLLFSTPDFPAFLYRGEAAAGPPEGLVLRVFGFLKAIGVSRSARQLIFDFMFSRRPKPGPGEGHRLVHVPVDEAVIERIVREFRFPGLADAVSKCFQLTNFDLEYEDRCDFLFDKMTMPVLFLQGALDPGQPKSDYDGLESVRPNFSIQWIEDAGHFLHLERPDAVTAAIRDFFNEQA